MRSYNQACGLAKALDLVGDRWSMLVVRELLIRGSCRYTDLKSGLPGIATNMLAERLADLESAGVIVRETLPPPSVANVFRLTETGLALEAALQELGKWGSRQMTDKDRRKPFLAHWMVLPLRQFLRDGDSKGLTRRIAIKSSEGELSVVADKGRINVEPGPTSQPDAVISGKGQAILRFLLAAIDRDRAAAEGVRITGNLRAVQSVVSGHDQNGSAINAQS